MDEYLTFNKNAKGLAKSASRALGSLMSKVVAQNVNTLRTYRLYKNSVKTEQYIKVSMSRIERRTMAFFSLLSSSDCD